MKRFIILLRGIMPGGLTKVPIASLKALLTSHGFQQVQSYIQTSNVLFRALLRIRIVYLVTTIILVALSFFAYFQLTNLIDSTNRINQSNQISLSLKTIGKAVVDAESNQKSYLLTGDSIMLAKRDLDYNRIKSELNVVDSLTKGNAEQNVNARILRGLVNKKLLNFKIMSQTYQPVEIAPAFGSSLIEGFRQTEFIIDEINEMTKLENQQLELRTNQYTRLSFSAPLLYIILSLGALLILFISYFKIATDLDQSQQLKSELKASNSELEKKNEELIQGGERFLKIFDNSPVAMTFAEIETNHVVYANNLFYSSFGYSKEEVIGHTTEELNLTSKEENERLIPIIMSHLQEERSIEELKKLSAEERANLLITLKEKMLKNGFEILYTRKNGETFYAIVYVEVIVIGGKSYSLTTYQDITARKRADKLLEQQNKTLVKVNKELESINYISSHDLQEPLRQIQVFTSRISEMEQQNLSSSGKIYFDKMNNAAKRMQNLISDLLTYSRSRIENRKFKTTNLNQIINQVTAELAEIIEDKNAIIEVDELGDANVIPFQFRQMMYNLIGNSLKFSKADTPPHIVIKNEKVKSSEVSGAEPNIATEYHRISIADNGIGFESEYKNKIFELFQRLHGKQNVAGTGIGLAIVKNIVENHFGIVEARGELNIGATFDIYIPVT